MHACMYVYRMYLFSLCICFYACMYSYRAAEILPLFISCCCNIVEQNIYFTQLVTFIHITQLSRIQLTCDTKRTSLQLAGRLRPHILLLLLRYKLYLALLGFTWLYLYPLDLSSACRTAATTFFFCGLTHIFLNLQVVHKLSLNHLTYLLNLQATPKRPLFGLLAARLRPHF
jgi:hypothetical protein